MLNKHDLRQLETQAGEIIKTTGQYIYQSWTKFDQIKTSLKDKRDVVTNIDIEAENRIREKLKPLLPEAGFIVEEGKSNTEVYNWVIDPIDGTKYFSSRAPLFVTQLALVHHQDPVIGLIYNPLSQQLFSASQNNGARLNQLPIKEQTRTDPKAAIIDWDGGGFFSENPWKITLYNAFLKAFYRIRSFGGVYSVYIVTSAFDVYAYLEEVVKIVDIKPNIIIMKEAGLETKTFHFSGHAVTVCSNQTLIDYIGTIITSLPAELITG